jgi:hypothetical protein
MAANDGGKGVECMSDRDHTTRILHSQKAGIDIVVGFPERPATLPHSIDGHECHRRLKGRGAFQLQFGTVVPLVTPVPKPSYRLVHEIQPGHRGRNPYFLAFHLFADDENHELP